MKVRVIGDSASEQAALGYMRPECGDGAACREHTVEPVLSYCDTVSCILCSSMRYKVAKDVRWGGTDI